MKTLKTKCGIEVTINSVEGVEARYANASVENRMKFAADMASVSFGRKNSKNPSKRWREFFVEAAGEIRPDVKCNKCKNKLSLFKEKENDSVVFYSGKCQQCGNIEVRKMPTAIDNSNWGVVYILKNFSEDVMIENGPSRPLENIPVKFYAKKQKNHWLFYRGLKDEGSFFEANDIFMFDFLKYSLIMPIDDGVIAVYTNLRNMVNSRFGENEVFNEDIPEFVAFRVRAPYFAFAQVRTHSKLTQIAQSDRWSKEDEYWLPEDIEERFREKGIFDGTKDEILKYLLALPPLKGQEELKRAGYPLEIYQRWPNHMKFKEWTISGFINDPDSILHFLLQRKAYPEIIKDKTQEQTAKIASMMRELLEWYMEERL